MRWRWCRATRVGTGPFPTELTDAIGQGLAKRGNEFGSVVADTLSTGWQALDQELPGHGWPCGSLTEVLSPQPSVLEWRNSPSPCPTRLP